MKQSVISPLMSFSLIISMAGCMVYFNEQFKIQKNKNMNVSGFRLEKELPMRVPRARPLRMFRTPPIVPGLISLADATIKLGNKLRGNIGRSEYLSELNSYSIPTSLQEEAKIVEQIESLAGNYVRNEELVFEMQKFSLVSRTVTARLLSVYCTLSTYDKPSKNVNELKSKVLDLLVDNSDVAYFEIMMTFEDTLSAFPMFATAMQGLVEKLDISKDESIAYYSRFLNRQLTDQISEYDHIDRQKTVHLALEKLKKQGLSEAHISAVVESLINANANDPVKRHQAIVMSKSYFPDYFDTPVDERVPAME